MRSHALSRLVGAYFHGALARFNSTPSGVCALQGLKKLRTNDAKSFDQSEFRFRKIDLPSAPGRNEQSKSSLIGFLVELVELTCCNGASACSSCTGRLIFSFFLQGAIDLLITIYKQEFARLGGYLTEDGEVSIGPCCMGIGKRC
jgi:hypothetical protein